MVGGVAALVGVRVGGRRSTRRFPLASEVCATNWKRRETPTHPTPLCHMPRPHPACPPPCPYGGVVCASYACTGGHKPGRRRDTTRPCSPPPPPPQRLSPPSLKARGSPKKEEGGPRDFTWGAWPPCPAKEKWRVALFPTSLVHEVQTGPGWTMADGDRSLHTTRRPWPAHTHTHGARWLVAAGRLGPTCHALTHSSLSPQCTETRPLVVG